MQTALFIRLFAVAALVILACGTAEAKERVALIIGNSEYEHVSNLPNPENDASDISAALERLGFQVTLGLNYDYRQMRLALRSFAEAAEGAEYALIYFAGHGVEIDNTNYLIPVNAELRTDRDIEFEAIRMSAVLNAVSPAKGVKIVLVDACRNNPFLVNMNRTNATRSIGRGLSRVDPTGVLVGYAARSGTLALDGEGRNSPYAQAILAHIEEPGLELGKMFRKIRDTVYEATDGYQEPFTYGSLPGTDIFLKDPLPEPPKSAGTDVAAAGNAAADLELIADFAEADRKGRLRDWNRFLQKYAARAEHRLVALALSKRDTIAAASEAKRRRYTREPWLKARFPDGQRDAVLTREQRKLVQEALNMMGLNVGAIDGAFGPRTLQAISTARVRNGLLPGTHVDLAFLRLLPDVPAIKALQDDKARRYLDVKLPEAMEPRLQKVVDILRYRPLRFGYYEGHLYVVVMQSDFMEWPQAQQMAQRVGGHLATIGSSAENRFIHDLFATDPIFTHVDSSGTVFGPMFGLYQADRSHEPSGGWAWVTGEPLGYRNFSPGNPDNYRGAQHYARFFRPKKYRGSKRGAIWWDDTVSSLWCCGYVIEIE